MATAIGVEPTSEVGSTPTSGKEHASDAVIAPSDGVHQTLPACAQYQDATFS